MDYPEAGLKTGSKGGKGTRTRDPFQHSKKDIKNYVKAEDHFNNADTTWACREDCRGSAPTPVYRLDDPWIRPSVGGWKFPWGPNPICLSAESRVVPGR